MRLLACLGLAAALAGCKADGFGDDLPENTTYACADCGKSTMAKTGDPVPLCHQKSMNPSVVGAAADIVYTCAACGTDKPLNEDGTVPECCGARMRRP